MPSLECGSHAAAFPQPALLALIKQAGTWPKGSLLPAARLPAPESGSMAAAVQGLPFSLSPCRPIRAAILMFRSMEREGYFYELG